MDHRKDLMEKNAIENPTPSLLVLFTMQKEMKSHPNFVVCSDFHLSFLSLSLYLYLISMQYH